MICEKDLCEGCFGNNFVLCCKHKAADCYKEVCSDCAVVHGLDVCYRCYACNKCAEQVTCEFCDDHVHCVDCCADDGCSFCDFCEKSICGRCPKSKADELEWRVCNTCSNRACGSCKKGWRTCKICDGDSCADCAKELFGSTETSRRCLELLRERRGW